MIKLATWKGGNMSHGGRKRFTCRLALLHHFSQEAQEMSGHGCTQVTMYWLQPGQKGLAFVQSRLYIIEEGDKIFRFQSSEVHIGSWETVQKIRETGLLRIDVHGCLPCLFPCNRMRRKHFHSFFRFLKEGQFKCEHNSCLHLCYVYAETDYVAMGIKYFISGQNFSYHTDSELVMLVPGTCRGARGIRNCPGSIWARGTSPGRG